MKTYKATIDNETIELIPIIHRYTNNVLAIELLTMEKESYAIITVNLTNALDSIVTIPEDCTFVDVNNAPWAEKFIQENNLGRHLDMYVQSGYVVYPLYKFNLNKLNQYQQMSLNDYN